MLHGPGVTVCTIKPTPRLTSSASQNGRNKNPEIASILDRVDELPIESDAKQWVKIKLRNFLEFTKQKTGKYPDVTDITLEERPLILGKMVSPLYTPIHVTQFNPPRHTYGYSIHIPATKYEVFVHLKQEETALPDISEKVSGLLPD